MRVAFWSTFVLAAPLQPGTSSYDTQLEGIVDLGYSKYQGTVLEAGVNQYIGIRFAAPPLGNLRWRAPIDPYPTSGIQNATAVSSPTKLDS